MSEMVLFSTDEFRLEITPDDADGFHVTAPPLARQLGFRDAADMLRTPITVSPIGDRVLGGAS